MKAGEDSLGLVSEAENHVGFVQKTSSQQQVDGDRDRIDFDSFAIAVFGVGQGHSDGVKDALIIASGNSLGDLKGTAMRTTTQALILQSTPAVAPPELGLVQDYGLVGLMGYLAIKEALGWWRQRGDTQQGLVTTLVADLRANNQELTNKLFELHSQQHADMVELRTELRGMCDQLSKIL